MGERKHVFTGLFWLAFAIFVAVMARDLGGTGTFNRPGAGFIFYWSAVGLGALSIVLIIMSLMKREEASSESAWKGVKWGNAVLAMGVLFVYALILQPIGYLLATLLLLLILFSIGRPPSLKLLRGSFVSALLTTAVSWVLFRIILEVPLPRGIFGYTFG